MTYIGDAFPSFLDNIVRKYDPQITIVNKNCSTFYEKFFSKIKDKVDKNQKSNIIYKIECNDCSGVYIGETKQLLKNRIYNHKRDIDINECNTALAEHCINNSHSFNFENCRVLHDNCDNVINRKFIEKMYIRKFKNTAVNFISDIKGIEMYEGIIRHTCM